MQLKTMTLDEVAQGGEHYLAKHEHTTVLSVNSDQIKKNVEANCKRGLAELTHQLPARSKGAHTLSLCGSAPSLIRTIPEIKGRVMACNGAIPALDGRGVHVDYPMIWDALPAMVRYVRAIPNATWMIASRVDPSVIDALLDLGQRILLWHVAGDDMEEFLGARMTVPGGRTGITRGAILGTVCMGFYDLHIFGADSCYSDTKETHVGGSVRDENEIVTVCDGRGFRSTLWMQLQAEDWADDILPALVYSGIKVTMHGDGLLPWAHRCWMKKNPQTRWGKMLKRLGKTAKAVRLKTVDPLWTAPQRAAAQEAAE